jgi:hypothetical protein
MTRDLPKTKRTKSKPRFPQTSTAPLDRIELIQDKRLTAASQETGEASCHLDAEPSQHQDALMKTTLRKGVTPADELAAELPPFEVIPKACGLRPGVDPAKLKQLNDELEEEHFLAKETGLARITGLCREDNSLKG